MRPRPLCTKLNEMLTSGLELGVFSAIQTHVVTGPLGRETLGPTTDIGMVSDFGVSLPEFVRLLEKQQFSAVFDDYSILMIECSFSADRIRRHRYSYIPCPVEPRLIVDRPQLIPIDEWISDRVSTAQSSPFRSMGTYRFDFDMALAESLVEGHPASHLTFASPSCRMPVCSPMSISHFLNFIFDNFQRPAARFWSDYAPFLTSTGIESTITEQEQLLHHIFWREEV